jgi:hypothetical protein
VEIARNTNINLFASVGVNYCVVSAEEVKCKCYQRTSNKPNNKIA